VAGQDCFFNFVDFLQRVVIAVEVSRGVVVGFAGPRISFGRTGEKGKYEEKRIYLKILQVWLINYLRTQKSEIPYYNKVESLILSKMRLL
jgi:hypothetical protein